MECIWENPRVERWCVAASCAFVALCVVACSRGGDQNLWSRDFSNPQSGTGAITTSDPTGYWEGEIAMGNVRAKIESGQITLAIKCDSDGKIVAQGSAPISIKKDEPMKMVLQTDLLSGGGDVCGFRFNKGNEFAYSFGQPGILKVNFAGTSVSELRKLSGLDNTK